VFACLASVAFALVGGLLSDLPLLLELVLDLPPVDHVLATQLQRIQHPLEQLRQGDRVFLDFLDFLFMLSESFLDESKFLV
jgi:hypothetical protein